MCCLSYCILNYTLITGHREARFQVTKFTQLPGADLGILWGGGSGPQFFEGGGGVRVQVRGNFHILTSKTKKKPLKGGV